MVDVSLISSADNVSDARMHRLSGALVRSGLAVEIIALGDASDAPADTIFRRAYGGKSFVDRIIRDLLLPFQTHGKVVIVVAPDLLITSRIMTMLRRQKLVADVHEDYVELLRDRKWAEGTVGKFAKLVAQVATSVAGNSDLLSVADSHVPPMKSRNRIVVRNLPDLSLITESGDLEEFPRAIYIGDVRTSRGLRTILSAAELAPDWTFDIIGSVAQADQDFLTKWQEQSATALRVRFHGKKSPKESWKFAKGAWVGLTLLEPTPAFLAAIPSKLYEYMAAGLATISTPLPRCVLLLEESGAGVVVDGEPGNVAEQLRQWQSDQSELLQIRSRAKNWAAENLDGEREYGAFAGEVAKLL